MQMILIRTCIEIELHGYNIDDNRLCAMDLMSARMMWVQTVLEINYEDAIPMVFVDTKRIAGPILSIRQRLARLG